MPSEETGSRSVLFRILLCEYRLSFTSNGDRVFLQKICGCFFEKIVLSSKLDQEGSALSLVGRALVSKTKGRWFESNSAWSNQ